VTAGLATLDWVRSVRMPAFASQRPRLRGTRAEGLRYERKAQAHFSGEYGPHYGPGPWFQFLEHGADRPRFCQPDALIFQPGAGLIIILEYKLRHTPEAWRQLSMYKRILQKAFSPALWTFCLCEVVRWFDPDTPFPVTFRRLADLSQASPEVLGVHIWR